MIAVRSLFAAFMALMVAGCVAQSSSSSSSSTGSYLSSSSAAPVNESSSSAVVILSSSSSTGSDVPSYLPYGTYQVFYQVELTNSVVTDALKNALRWDFAETLANNTVFNTTRTAVYEYLRIDVALPVDTAPLAAVNASTTAWILGNITNILPANTNTEALAQTFVNAAANGAVFTTESSSLGAKFYPQQVTYLLAPYASSSTGGDGGNGASSATSVSLLIGSMIAALALAL